MGVYRVVDALHEAAVAVLVLPGLVGAVLAAQPLATDFERGRHLLLWSQSVSPRRWLTHRLALPAGAVLVLGTVLSTILRWAVFWSRPAPSLDYWNSAFTVQVMVPAYPALMVTAFVIGALVGLLLHRVIPALGVTLGLYAALVYGLDQLSPFLLPFHRAVLPPGVEAPAGAWVLDSGAVWNGKEIPFSQCPDTGCVSVPTWLRYHPVSQLGPMLWIETGILAALTAGLVALAFRRLRALTR
jgi:hypothetical protein